MVFMETKINTQPFFSIIIPTLNEEHYSPTLLSCLPRQTFRDFEVIVCDGTSGDKTIEVAAKFQDTLPKLTIVNNLKRNVSFQRNRGAKIAQGNYLYFMDADVTIPSYFLKSLHKNIINKKISVATTWLVPDSKHPADEAMIFLTNIIVDASRYLDMPFAPGFNIIVKKDVFTKIGGFKEHVIHAEDHHFVKEAQAKGYLLSVFREPKLTASLRRLRREGRLTVARKFAKATFYILLRGPITKDIFDYQMGGHYFGSKNKDKKDFSSFLKSLSKNGEKKVIKVFKEIFEFP